MWSLTSLQCGICSQWKTFGFRSLKSLIARCDDIPANLANSGHWSQLAELFQIRIQSLEKSR